MERHILISEPQTGYELVDCGEEEKLERYGDILLTRPDPQALWTKVLDVSQWNKAHAKFIRSSSGAGKWNIQKEIPKAWDIAFGGLQLLIKATSFKHTGLFPEQVSNWTWIKDNIETRNGVTVLNLFAYTGGATLIAAKAGAKVTHVDASKTAISWARDNAKLSDLDSKPIRWIVEDTIQFVKREIKRGVKYDAIIMDPPAFGHGPKDELWKIEENFIELSELCMQLLSDKPLFVLMSGYAAGYSPLMFAYNLERFKAVYGGTIECGDLTIKQSAGQAGERLLPCGIYGRWSV